jgi:CheY-like chemotaxis protein
MAKTKHLLVVDDIPFMRHLLSLHLRSIGPRVLKEELGFGNFDILEAANGKEALKLLHGHSVDVVFLDLMMPEMDGLTFLNVRKQNKSLAAVPVIIVSALHDKSTIDRAAQLGVDAFLVKPVDAKKLEDSLRKALAGLREPSTAAV